MGSQTSRCRKYISHRSDAHPPYDTISSETLPASKIATSIPQWLWIKAQCIAWVEAVLIHYIGRSPDEASNVASKFVGCGPTLWTKSLNNWQIWLGREEGNAIWDMMSGMYENKDMRKQGIGIPDGLCVRQYTVSK